MKEYIDLSSIIDCEPTICSVLDLIDDENIINEVSNRMTEGFARDLVKQLNEADFLILKKAIEKYETKIY